MVWSWGAILAHWDLVYVGLLKLGVDIFSDAGRARPWPATRALIFHLLFSDEKFRTVIAGEVSDE